MDALVRQCPALGGATGLSLRTPPAEGWRGTAPRRSIPSPDPMHAVRLRLILALLDQAVGVSDVDAPGLRLHPLKGKLKGHWALTVQANWRVTFRFKDGDAHVVDYQDYH